MTKFIAGPEVLRFGGAETVFVDDAMAIVAAHKEAKAMIEKAFGDAVERARVTAETAMRELNAQTRKKIEQLK